MVGFLGDIGFLGVALEEVDGFLADDVDVFLGGDLVLEVGSFFGIDFFCATFLLL